MSKPRSILSEITENSTGFLAQSTAEEREKEENKTPEVLLASLKYFFQIRDQAIKAVEDTGKRVPSLRRCSFYRNPIFRITEDDTLGAASRLSTTMIST